MIENSIWYQVLYPLIFHFKHSNLIAHRIAEHRIGTQQRRVQNSNLLKSDDGIKSAAYHLATMLSKIPLADMEEGSKQEFADDAPPECSLAFCWAEFRWCKLSNFPILMYLQTINLMEILLYRRAVCRSNLRRQWPFTWACYLVLRATSLKNFLRRHLYCMTAAAHPKRL